MASSYRSEMRTESEGEGGNTLLDKKVKKEVVPLPLPRDVCIEIAKHVHESEALAFAMTCTGFRDGMKDALKTRKRSARR